MFQPSWDEAYATTSAGVSPVSSLSGRHEQRDQAGDERRARRAASSSPSLRGDRRRVRRRAWRLVTCLSVELRVERRGSAPGGDR